MLRIPLVILFALLLVGVIMGDVTWSYVGIGFGAGSALTFTVINIEMRR